MVNSQAICAQLLVHTSGAPGLQVMSKSLEPFSKAVGFWVEGLGVQGWCVFILDLSQTRARGAGFDEEEHVTTAARCKSSA